jgi:ubiquinone/menaquinone biosynthesis C-methylase UbiE
MPNKLKFIAEMVRVLKPGGRLIIATWCHRELGVGEALSPAEEDLLSNINDGNIISQILSGYLLYSFFFGILQLIISLSG